MCLNQSKMARKKKTPNRGSVTLFGRRTRSFKTPKVLSAMKKKKGQLEPFKKAGVQMNSRLLANTLFGRGPFFGFLGNVKRLRKKLTEDENKRNFVRLQPLNLFNTIANPNNPIVILD